MKNNLRVDADGQLDFLGKTYHCAVGRSGFSQNKQEGDGITPIGEWPIREILYRADRVSEPLSIFPTRPITENDGWCDDSTDRNYNKLVTLPYPASHEKLFREDDVYNIIVVLGYNDNPPVPGKGSAIFLHLARPGYPPTAGWVATAEDDLREILAGCNLETKVVIG